VGRGSPLVDTDARAAALLRLMLEAIDLRLSELRYMAAEGGLSLEIVNHSFNSPVAGLRLALLGWAGRVETLLCDVVRAIAALEVRRPPPPPSLPY
jgi:secreted Zn-dependent insulinase-like peptidase